MVKSAYNKDIWRSIRKSKKRFISIAVITALGMTVLLGIYAAVQDMYYSSDRFYDEQRLFDIRVRSTLGLTDEDLDALGGVAGIAAVDGGYNEKVYTHVAGARKSVDAVMLSTQGMNMPYVLAGALPARAGEIAVTQAYLNAAGKQIGDNVTIEEVLDNEESAGTGGEAEELPEKNEPVAGDDDKLDTDIDWDADIEVEKEESPTFRRATFTITGIVLDPMDISSKKHNTSFRSTTTADYTFFVTSADVDTEVYTSVYVLLQGVKELDCYGVEYDKAIQDVIDRIEAQIKSQREEARYHAVMNKALDKIAEARGTMDEKFAEADEKFADAWAEVAKAKQDIIDGQATLTEEERDALQKLADARAEIEEGRQELRDAQEELDAGEAELWAGEDEIAANAKKLAEGKQKLAAERQTAEAGFAAAEQLMDAKQGELNHGLNQLTPGIQGLQGAFGANWPQSQWNALVNAAAAKAAGLIAANPQSPPDPAEVAAATGTEQAALDAAIALTGDPMLTALTQDCVEAALGMGIVNGGQQALNGQKALYNAQKAAALQQLADAEAELAAGEAQLEAGKKELAAGWVEWRKGRSKLLQGWQDLREGEAKLNEEEDKALKELADAWLEIADGKRELAEGQAELIANEEKYQDKKAEAEQKIADAYTELADIDMTEWYVQDRDSLDSFSSMRNDMKSIGAVGNIFPVIFLTVAILISLTTMTRMVEEDRGLIGTYKALGLRDKDIYRKYLLYSFLACLLGSCLGFFLGFVALPSFLFSILGLLYNVPHMVYRFSVPLGLGGAVLFTASIVGATALACRSELKQMPAPLMRPKAPRPGSRVLLERIPLIWNRLSFLNKVTMRNLFRYKKRLFMTVGGIVGCTALVLTGFAIKDSVTGLRPKQYEQIYRYDLMAVADSEDNDELVGLVTAGGATRDYINLQVENIKVLNTKGESESVQLMVVPTGGVMGDYISLTGLDGKPATLGATGVLLTQNASEILGIGPGDDIVIQNLLLDQYHANVSAIVKNYLGNTVFITEELYKSLYGDFKPNAILAHFSDVVADQRAFTDQLKEHDMIRSAISIEAANSDFAGNFTLINSVVYVLTLLAAGLAFVVLFTLSNTNISERQRELATIKVLGFFDSEVHAYVNKETLILTLMGIVLGLPVGRMISGLLTAALKMPSLYFAVTVYPISYVLSAVISFSFALIVNIITNRTLDRIDMVEALKSVE